MSVDADKVQAYGPWVLVRAEALPHVLESGLYLPEGNLYDRIGYSTAKVLSVAKGYWHTTKKGKKVFVKHDLVNGERVLFRGHLKEANKIGDACFIHVNDVIGVLGEGSEVGLCLPHDN